MNKKSFLFSVFFILLFTSSLHSQSIRINLDSLSTLDSEGIHILFFEGSPKEKIILPDFGASKPKYFEMFYSRDTKDDESISCAVLQKEDYELLFVDANNDEDLTNDQPLIFPYSRNELYIDIVSQTDSNQKLRLKLFRQTSYADTIQSKFLMIRGI